MSGPQRKPDQTAISISMPKSMLEMLDERAQALGLTRSGYISALMRADIASGGPLTLHDLSAPKSNPLASGVPAAAGDPKPISYFKRK